MKKLRVCALVLSMLMAFSFALTACGGNNDDPVDVDKTYTQHDYISTTPATWNELDSTDANNDAIMGYIGSAFFSYDYKFEGGKFKADGSINVEGIVPGSFTTNYDAAVALEDVTAKVDAKWGYTDEQKTSGGYAWKITLRDNLKWDDGTPIKAEDFVYSMQEQLNPLFQLGRSDTYYNNAVKIRNAKGYVYQGQSGMFPADAAYDAYSEDLDSNLIVEWFDPEAPAQAYFTSYLSSYGYGGNVAFEAFGSSQEEAGVTYAQLEAMSGMTLAEVKADAELSVAWNNLVTWWGEGADGALHFTIANYTYPAVNFADVGIYSEGDYDIVLILDQPMYFFDEDGELSYLAAYNFSSLPLVKKDLYEACKQKPQAGSELWTTTYCTSLATSASWGPYKLTEFQEGKSFKLERNKHWYGYSLETNKGQYLTDAIETEVIAKEEAQQLAFWAGEVDGLGISVVLAPDYKDSPYAVYSPRVATFGINIHSGLDTLLAGERNNTVLAIKDFRQALSLSLDRDAYNKDLSTANKTCLGLVNEDYYHNVAKGEVYRYTIQAKETLLSAYGFSKTPEGKWTDGSKVYDDIESATRAMNGMNLELAKEKLESAWVELNSKPEVYKYDSSKPIQICVGESEDSEAAKRSYNWIKNWIDTLCEGTSFEGKIEVTYDPTFGAKWDTAFMEGEYDICTGGIGNAPFDPFYLIGGWIGMMPSVNFHPYWPVDTDVITHTLPVVEGFAQSGEELSLTARDWYNSLNGSVSEDQCSYDWANAPVEVRLDILAMLEKYGLEKYYTIPTSRGFTASLHSAKWNYISEDYNTMMGFGGIRYITYNYSDAEWEAFVEEHGGDLRDFYKGGK
ncbi:MAG: hypothetical protein IJC87_06295 [Clostridia bacterium]|nr:hypothetical protein [Clostridia bacterium]